jgi:hypothetical protein
MRSRTFLASLSAVVMIGVAHAAVAGSPANDGAERIRHLRRQVEQNDAQIRVLEETIRKAQAGKGAIGPGTRSSAVASRRGEISAWSTGGPTTTPAAPIATERPPRPGVVAPVAPRWSGPGRSPRAALHGAGRSRSPLADAPLKAGMPQVSVWDTLGPPEFVRGRRTEVQYWYYGGDWIRFQAGRITRWVVGATQLRADRK